MYGYNITDVVWTLMELRVITSLVSRVRIMQSV